MSNTSRRELCLPVNIIKTVMEDTELGIQVLGQHNGLTLMKKDVANTLRSLQNSSISQLYYMNEAFMKYYVSLLNVNKEDPGNVVHYCSGNINLIELFKDISHIDGMIHLVVHQFNGRYFIVFKIHLKEGNKVHVSCFDPQSKNKGKATMMKFKTVFDKDDELSKKYTLELDLTNKTGDLLGTEQGIRFFKEWHNGIYVCYFLLNSLYGTNISIHDGKLKMCYYKLVLSMLTGIQLYH